MLKINKNTEPKIGMYFYLVNRSELAIRKVYITGIKYHPYNGIFVNFGNKSWFKWKDDLFTRFWTSLKKAQNVVKTLEEKVEREKVVTQERHALYCNLSQFNSLSKEKFLHMKIAIKNYGYRGTDKNVPWVIREVVSVHVSNYIYCEPAITLQVHGSHNSYFLHKEGKTWKQLTPELEYEINKAHLEDNLKYYTEALKKLENEYDKSRV